MDKSKIYAIMRKTKMLQLWDKGNVQWISNGYAAYPLYGLPKFDEDGIKLLLGIADSKQAEYKITTSPGVADEMITSDNHGIPLDPVPVSINGYVTFVDSEHGNYYFCNAAYLTPTADGVVSPEYYLRGNGSDHLIAVCHGWTIEAIISQYKLLSTNGLDLAAVLRGAADAVVPYKAD